MNTSSGSLADPNLLQQALERAPWRAVTMPEDLVEAWRQAHHAAQAIAEVGKAWGNASDDDSHSAFEVVEPEGWFLPEGVDAPDIETPGIEDLPRGVSPVAGGRGLVPALPGGGDGVDHDADGNQSGDPHASPAATSPAGEHSQIALPADEALAMGPILRGPAIEADSQFAATMAIVGHGLALVGIDDGSVLACRPIAGQRTEDLREWIRGETIVLTGTPPRQEAKPAPDLPHHPVAEDEPFPQTPPSDEARCVLADLYAGTARMLAVLRAMLPPTDGAADQTDASGRRDRFRFNVARDILVWPHHFDLAWLHVAGQDAANNAKGEAAMTRTVGIGLAVPDSIDDSGYWYVSPWNREGRLPSSIAWPDLDVGRWIESAGENTKMAVLPIRDLIEAAAEERGSRTADEETAAIQRRLLARFLAQATSACITAVHAAD
ncbi:MAG: hypothetical protein ACOC0P_06890 [Planctomycetota bacterium]